MSKFEKLRNDYMQIVFITRVMECDIEYEMECAIYKYVISMECGMCAIYKYVMECVRYTSKYVCDINKWKCVMYVMEYVMENVRYTSM